jgi:hypothetical protein
MSDDEDFPLAAPGYLERLPFERMHLTGTADYQDEDGLGVSFPDGEAEPMVWLAQPAEDLRRNHGMVVLARGKNAVAYEMGGWQDEKPIDRLFALAGYTPPKPVSTAPQPVNVDEQAFAPIMGFKAPSGTLGSITMRLAQAMKGEMGGFSSLSLGQLGFHQAHTAFMAAWEVAGKPPIHKKQPQWVDLGASVGGAPLPVADALEKHIGHGSSLEYWDGQKLFDDEDDIGSK